MPTIDLLFKGVALEFESIELIDSCKTSMSLNDVVNLSGFDGRDEVEGAPSEVSCSYADSGRDAGFLGSWSKGTMGNNMIGYPFLL